jgi:NTE family protein
MSTKLVTLALQGGGSHGAFTWGVLDRLLEDERFKIEGISGASAGAMNAVVLAHGFTTGGREGAREALKVFWESVASKAPFNFIPSDLSAPLADGSASPSPAFKVLLSLARFFSPYQLNPFDVDPLRDLLASQIDFERLRGECRIKLFIAATQVSTGTLRLFRNAQMSLDVLLASACLPSINRPVEIDGEAYWDGGLAANPPISPLLHQCAARDIIAVLLNPCRRPNTPTTADEIWHRLTEISFSSSFFTELHWLALAKREADRSLLPFGRLERRLRRLNTHVIDAQELMSQLSAISKLNTHPDFVNALRDEGRSRAEAWLNDNFPLIGVQSSFGLEKFLQE